MFKRFCVVSLALFLISAPAVAEDTVYNETLFEASPGTTVKFLSTEEKHIHIGDGRGYVADIPSEHLTKSPPKAYGWRFNLSKEAASAELHVTMYSLTNAFGCSTLVKLNGEKLKDLSLLPDADAWRTAATTIAIKERLKAGMNEIVISEEQCGKTYSPSWNDSLIIAVTIRID